MYGYNAEPPIAIPIYTVLPYCVIRTPGRMWLELGLGNKVRDNNCGIAPENSKLSIVILSYSKCYIDYFHYTFLFYDHFHCTLTFCEPLLLTVHTNIMDI